MSTLYGIPSITIRTHTHTSNAQKSASTSSRSSIIANVDLWNNMSSWQIDHAHNP